MKYYSYSVKDTLVSYFGEDAVQNMRHLKSGEEIIHNKERYSKHIPMCWRGADREILFLFRNRMFLQDTILMDDYIAYMLCPENGNQVLLMFMADDQTPEFRMTPEYARQLENEWKERGFNPLLVWVCVGVHHLDQERYRIWIINQGAEGAHFYKLYTMNGQDFLVRRELPSRELLLRKALYAINSLELMEYECLFDPGVAVQQEQCTGIQGALQFFAKHGPVSPVLEKEPYGETYRQRLACDGQILAFTVGRNNLICRIDMTIPAGSLIPDPAFQDTGSLYARIPSALTIRMLDPVQMHALAVQTTWEDGSTRNYYIKTFDTLTIPDKCEEAGYTFDVGAVEILFLDAQQNAVFSNGMTIPRHILYSQSYRQIDIEKPAHIYGNPEGTEIRPIYRLPVMERFSDFFLAGGELPCEEYGPGEPWVDGNGNRSSDIAIWSGGHGSFNYTLDAWPVCVEPTGKYGYIRENGTWLAPPVFDWIENNYPVGCVAAAMGTGERQAWYVIFRDRGPVPMEYEMNLDKWAGLNLMPFNTIHGDQLLQFPEGLYDEDYEPFLNGNWGFMDSSGRIVIQPQYVFAIGPLELGHKWEEYYTLVGKEDEQGGLLLGAVNDRGEEFIPCKHAELHWLPGDVYAYRLKDSDRYGLLDWDGKLLAEPAHWFIDRYDRNHRMIAAGDKPRCLGVYSLEHGKAVISPQYVAVFFQEQFISCRKWSHNAMDMDYYSYDGTLLTSEGCIRESNQDGLLELWKGDTVQLVRTDGTPVTAPGYTNRVPWKRENIQKGYYIFRSGEPEMQGVSAMDGTVLVPAEYDSIEEMDGMIHAIRSAYDIHVFSESLFRIDGSPVIQGNFRHMWIEDERWYELDPIFTVETPKGKEYCRILDHEAICRNKDIRYRNRGYLKTIKERNVPASYLLTTWHERIDSSAPEAEQDAELARIAEDIEKRFPLKQ